MKHCTTFQFAAVCKTLGTTHLVSKKLTFKYTVIRQSRGMRTLNSGRQPYVRPVRNNENRSNSIVGIITLNFVSYKVRTAVPFDYQTVSLYINAALVRERERERERERKVIVLTFRWLRSILKAFNRKAIAINRHHILCEILIFVMKYSLETPWSSIWASQKPGVAGKYQTKLNIKTEFSRLVA